MQLTFDPTNASEVEQVTSILTVLGTEPQAATVVPVRQSDTFVAVFVENVGDESWRFVAEALRHFGPGVEFTFEQLSAKSGIPVSELKAWHRNLSRTARWAGGQITQVIEAEWKDGRQHYTVTPELAAAAGNNS